MKHMNDPAQPGKQSWVWKMISAIKMISMVIFFQLFFRILILNSEFWENRIIGLELVFWYNSQSLQKKRLNQNSQIKVQILTFFLRSVMTKLLTSPHSQNFEINQNYDFDLRKNVRSLTNLRILEIWHLNKNSEIKVRILCLISEFWHFLNLI